MNIGETPSVQVPKEFLAVILAGVGEEYVNFSVIRFFVHWIHSPFRQPVSGSLPIFEESHVQKLYYRLEADLCCRMSSVGLRILA